MARTFSELWRISSRMYREAAFQSAFVLKRGGQLAQMQSSAQFEQAIAVNTWVSKGILSLFIALLVVGAQFAVAMVEFPGVPDAIARGVVAGLVVLTMLLLVVLMSLDLTTGFMSSMVVQAIAPLPLSRREVETASLLAFARIFDLPLAIGVMAFPVAHLILTRSAVGAFAYAAAAAASEAFAIALAMALAEFFCAKILNQSGSGVKSIVRVIYTVIWMLPAIGLMLAFHLQAAMGRAVVSLVAGNPAVAPILSFVYPFSFGFLISFATAAPGAGRTLLVSSALASVVYVGLAAQALRWASSRLRTRALGGAAASAGPRTLARHFRVRPVAPWLGVLLKDMRIILRSPSEAGLFLMPAAATVPWAVTVGARGSPVVASGVMGSIVFLSLMVVPVLHNAEAVGHAYTRSLPVKPQWLLGAKAAAGTLAYVVSACVLIVVAAATRRADATLFLAFGASGIPAAASAVLVTGLILMSRSGRSALRISPYASPFDFMSAIIVGGLVAAVPSVAAAVGASLTGLAELPLHFAASIGEFAVVLMLVISIRAGRRD